MSNAAAPPQSMRFGLFLSPIHAPDEDPTLALHRDVELIRHMDWLGYDEAWIGEHHSTGWEIISSPEVFIGYLAGLTSRIRLGTGVISLPYHHPYNVAERLVLLDHLTRGRTMFGFGPGALTTDARQLGIDPAETRSRFTESLETIMALLAGQRISRNAGWFDLDQAMVQLPNYSRPHPEIAVTASVTPTGAALAGKYGLSLLSLIATQPNAIVLLADHWKVVEENAALHGRTADRRNWRMVGPIHVAESEKQARKDVAYGLRRWIHYMSKVTTLHVVPEKVTSTDEYVDILVDKGYAVIGTPDQAIKQIHRLLDASGGFGTFLLWAHDWADRDATLRSLEMFYRYVTPTFTSASAPLMEAERYATQKLPEFLAQGKAARQKAIDDYAAQRGKGS